MDGKFPQTNHPQQFHQTSNLLAQSSSKPSSNAPQPYFPSQFVQNHQQIAASFNPFCDVSPQQIVQQLVARTGLDPMQLAKLFAEQQSQHFGSPNQMQFLSAQQQQQWLAQRMANTNKQIVVGNGGAITLTQPHLHGEEMCDSGNETSSLSPGHTPMTASSPHSMPSRSNSFSVSSILRTDKSEKKSEECKLSGKKEPNANVASDNTLQSSMTPIAAPIPQRLPFGLVQQQPQNPTQIPTPQIALQRNQLQQNPMVPSMQGLFGQRQNATNMHHQNPHQPSMLQANGGPFIPSATSPGGSLTGIPAGMQQFLLSNPSAMLALFHQQHQMQMQQQNQLYHLSGEYCLVCGDRASGHHYGVQSCEGCKGFFRRSIQSNAQHQCLKMGKCHVDRMTRNRCQKCRLDKCIQVGMQPTHVRLEKNKKRKSDMEPRESMLEGMRQNMELTKSIVDAFKAIFMQNSAPPENNPTLPLPIVPIPNIVAGHQLLSRFIEAVNVFKEMAPAEKEFLLLRVPIILVILAVFANREEMIMQMNLSNQKFNELKAIFTTGNRSLSLEEAALLLCFALTATDSEQQNKPQAIEKLHIWIWKCTSEQIHDRNSEDDENIEPIEIFLNLMRVNFQSNFR